MPEVNVDVSPAEVFKAAAEEARKALAAGIPEDVAPSDESGSSPANGAESVVPEITTPVVEEASKETVVPEVKVDKVEIDPDAAWNEYKTDEDRKKALAHNKAYAAQMAQKARDLEAQLAEKKVDPAPVVEEKPEAPVVEKDYDTWVAESLKQPDTKEKEQLSELANEYNRHLVEKLAPAESAAKEAEAKVREAEASLKDAEATLKFLQSRKDPTLYESDIAEAKERLSDARFEFTSAKDARLEALSAHQKAEETRLSALGVLRREARTVYEGEIKARKDSESTRRAEEESTKHQAEVNKSWEDSKAKALESRGNLTPEAKQLLLNAADGAIVRAATENKTISPADYLKFIEDSWKPFQSTAEQVRQDAVKAVIAITDEPTPAKPTSTTKNVDATPTDYNEWRAYSRKILSKAS